MSVASETWTGWIQLVNFMDEEVGGREFVCLELTQAGVECLWAQLPEEPGGSESPSLDEVPLQCMPQQYEMQGGESITMDGVPAPVTLPSLLSLICPSSMGSAPAWLQLKRFTVLTVNTDSPAVYTDGSFQGAGSVGCCSGAGVVVMEGDRPLQEVAIQLGGWAASTKAEVYACIAALAALPPLQAVHIHTDSQGLIVGFESFVTKAHLQTL